jgi:hypothetical protein
MTCLCSRVYAPPTSSPRGARTDCCSAFTESLMLRVTDAADDREMDDGALGGAEIDVKW